MLIAGGLTNSDQTARGEPEIIIQLPLTRMELANYLGLTPETVSRNITRLKRKGLIEFQTLRSVVILNIGQLASEADYIG